MESSQGSGRGEKLRQEQKEAFELFDAIVKERESSGKPIKRSRVIALIECKLDGPVRKTIKRWLEDHRPEVE